MVYKGKTHPEMDDFPIGLPPSPSPEATLAPWATSQPPRSWPLVPICGKIIELHGAIKTAKHGLIIPEGN